MINFSRPFGQTSARLRTVASGKRCTSAGARGSSPEGMVREDHARHVRPKGARMVNRARILQSVLLVQCLLQQRVRHCFFGRCSFWSQWSSSCCLAYSQHHMLLNRPRNCSLHRLRQWSGFFSRLYAALHSVPCFSSFCSPVSTLKRT